MCSTSTVEMVQVSLGFKKCGGCLLLQSDRHSCRHHLLLAHAWAVVKQTFAALLPTLTRGQGDRRGIVDWCGLRAETGSSRCSVRRVLSRNKKVESRAGLITYERRVNRHTARQPVAFWSALTGIITLTIVSWLVWSWQWLCFLWQCKLSWRCGAHDVQMTRTKFFARRK